MILCWLIGILLLGGLFAWLLGGRWPLVARWISLVAIGIDLVLALTLWQSGAADVVPTGVWKTTGAISTKVTFLDLLRPKEWNESKKKISKKKKFLSFLEKIVTKFLFFCGFFLLLSFHSFFLKRSRNVNFVEIAPVVF